MRQFCLLLLILSSLSACIDPVDLPIRNEEPRLVVEGQITNEAPPYTVRLTYTGNYGSEIPDDRLIQDAQVSLSDDQGRSTRLVSISSGRYQTTDSTFRGQIGRSYSLTVRLNNGKTYVSKPEQMPAVPAIDSLSAELIRTDNFAKPFQFAYRITMRDPASERNFYRWTAYGYTNRLSTGTSCGLGSPSICFNRCWTTVSSENVNVYSDNAINGNPIRERLVLQVPIYAIGPQLVEVQQYGITQSNYQFCKRYDEQKARTGSIFDPLPAPITGNLVNTDDPTDVARGYFAVTSVTRRRIRAQDYDVRLYTALYGFIEGQLIPKGDCRDTYGPVPVSEPDGWR